MNTKNYSNEDIFEAAIEITAAAAEEAEAPLTAEGGKAAAEFFRAVYDGIAAPDETEDIEGGCFEVYRDGAGEYRFRLKARNGEIIAVSEGYKRKDSCVKGITSVKRHARLAVIEDEKEK